jgi:hypothetical protein
MSFSSRTTKVTRPPGLVARPTSRRIARFTARCPGPKLDITCFPTEILVEVFSQCWPTLPPGVTISVEDRESLANFIRLSHVCRLWRMTMLGAAGLWSTPPCWNLNLTLLFLERAGNTPLSVILRHGQDWQLPKADARALLGRIAYVQNLHLDFGDDLVELGWVVNDVLTQPAPKLRTLTMVRDARRHGVRAASIALPMLPPGFLRECGLFLVALCLRGYSLSHNWQICGTIRNLELSSVHLSSASSLVESLAFVPRLAVLKLSYIRYGVRGGASSLVTLSQLDVFALTFHDDSHNALFLLEHISCPGLRNIDMSGRADLDNIGALIQAARLNTLLRRQSDQFLSASLSTRAIGVQVTCKGAKGADGTRGVAVSLDVCLGKGQDVAMFTIGLVALLPELRLKTLEIRSPGFSQSTWTQFLETWSDTLENITVKGTSSVAGLISALDEHFPRSGLRRMGDTQPADSDAMQPLLLQHLRSIDIRDLSLDEANESGSLGDVLKAVLTARAEAGLLPSRLVFARCGAVWSAEVIRELQTIGAVMTVCIDSIRYTLPQSTGPRRSSIRNASS